MSEGILCILPGNEKYMSDLGDFSDGHPSDCACIIRRCQNDLLIPLLHTDTHIIQRAQLNLNFRKMIEKM